MSVTAAIHYENIDGMTGWCQDIRASQANIDAMENEMSGMGGAYAHPEHGVCTNSGPGQCSQISPDIKSCLWMSGAEQEDIDRVQSNVEMWGGAGHNEAHAVLTRHGTSYCMQVKSP